jgi:hypothetical protein
MRRVDVPWSRSQSGRECRRDGHLMIHDSSEWVSGCKPTYRTSESVASHTLSEPLPPVLRNLQRRISAWRFPLHGQLFWWRRLGASTGSSIHSSFVSLWIQVWGPGVFVSRVLLIGFSDERCLCKGFVKCGSPRCPHWNCHVSPAFKSWAMPPGIRMHLHISTAIPFCTLLYSGSDSSATGNYRTLYRTQREGEHMCSQTLFPPLS